jgi:GDP-4-dehydro-6-deoxy-D-mannose reductase
VEHSGYSVRILITGVSGFAGSHLADHLLSQSERVGEVWGCDRSGERRPFHPPALQMWAADLLDPEAARQMVEAIRPEQIYHLVGQAHVGESWENPWATLETNLRSQLNLCEAVLAAKLTPRILVLGSMEEYGRVSPDELPIKETHPLRPDSPYGVSKVGQDMLGLQYHLSRQLPIIRVRPFNHIGPRQARKFVAPAFASQIAAIEIAAIEIAAIEASQPPPVLKVGNLNARRDFTDVRDMVRAYRLALEHGEPGEVYNIGSGQSHSIRELLDTLLSLSATPIQVETNPALLRPVDVPDVVCDSTRLRTRTGWQPRIPFEHSLRDLLEYERQLVRAGQHP